MEHLITELDAFTVGMDKNVWSFRLPNGTIKSFAQMEDEGWELAGVFDKIDKYFIWKRQRLG